MSGEYLAPSMKMKRPKGIPKGAKFDEATGYWTTVDKDNTVLYYMPREEVDPYAGQQIESNGAERIYPLQYDTPQFGGSPLGNHAQFTMQIHGFAPLDSLVRMADDRRSVAMDYSQAYPYDPQYDYDPSALTPDSRASIESAPQAMPMIAYDELGAQNEQVETFVPRASRMAKLTTFVIMSALLAGPVQQTFPVGVEAMQDCAKNNFFAIPGNLGCFGDHIIASGKKYIPKFLVPEKQ